MSFREKFPVISYYFGKKLQILSTYFYRKNPVKWSIKSYKRRFGRELNLENPELFYDKMNYWKHFKYSPAQDDLTDKVKVKEVLEALGYESYVAKCYVASDNIKSIKAWFMKNHDKIKKFVFKTSHSCGDVFIYNDGIITKKGGRRIKNINQVFKMLKIGLKFNHYYSRFEQNYKNLKHQIFVEEYIDIDNQAVEYELMCNYGEVKFSNIVLNRQDKKAKEIIFDSNFKFIDMNIGEFDQEAIDSIREPKDYQNIQTIIKKLCSEFPFCRVDFIQTKEKTYFCEFTFVKSGGMNFYKNYPLNEKLGQLFKL